MVCILVVEKNTALQQQIRKAMEEMRYRVFLVTDTTAAVDTILSTHVDLVLANMELGACDLCHGLREVSDDVPFITLIDSASKRDKRLIFRSRADGYLEIPFDSEELQMRIRNLLWRCHIEDSAVVRYGDCRLSTDTFSLETGSASIQLRRMEFLLLEKLLSYPGRIFTRAQLMDELWGYDCESNPRTVDTHVRQLRKKLNITGTIRIQTIRGIGYRAAIPNAAADEHLTR